MLFIDVPVNCIVSNALKITDISQFGNRQHKSCVLIRYFPHNRYAYTSIASLSIPQIQPTFKVLVGLCSAIKEISMKP